MPDFEEKKPHFVNREYELQKLHEYCDWVIEQKETKFAFIQGDYGVGKTALVEHFLAQKEKQLDSIMIGRGKCSMETEGSGLTPFSELYTNLVEQGIQWKIIGESVWEFTKKIAPAWLDVVTMGIASAAVTGIDEVNKALKDGYSKFSQENVFIQYTNALESITNKHPAILFIDDLQWADQSSLRLLFHLANHLKASPILFIVTYRPVEAMETSQNAPLFRNIRANLLRMGVVELELKDGLDANSYINQRYSLNKFPPELAIQVQKQTEGHALFISQLFSSWEETGVLQIHDTLNGLPIWVLTKDTPDLSNASLTLSAILDERIRLMGKRLQDILTRASIEGEDFSAQSIINLLELDELQAYEDIELLERNYQLVQEQETKQIGNTVFDMYRFSHRFFREHIYAQLNTGQRRILHRQVGECLEGLHTNQFLIAGQLARHFNEANQYLKATKYALMAAKFEQSRYSWDEGESQCNFGLSLIKKLDNDTEIDFLKLSLVEQSGEGHYFAGNYDQANNRYREAIDLATQLEVDYERIPTICVRLSEICDEKGLYEEGLYFIEKGKHLLDSDSLVKSEVQLAINCHEGLLRIRLGQNDLGSNILQEVIASAQTLMETPSLKYILLYTYNALGILFANQNNYPRSILSYQKAFGLAEEINYTYMATIALINQAYSLILFGNSEEAYSVNSKALAIARKIGSSGVESWALGNRGEINLILGKFHEAISDSEQAINLIEKSGSVWGLSYSYNTIALAQIALSNFDIAYEYAMKSINIVGIDNQMLAYSMDVLGRVETSRENYKEAVECFENALVLSSEFEDRHLNASTQRHYAETLFLMGEYEKALALIHVCLATFTNLDLTYEIDETESLLEQYK